MQIQDLKIGYYVHHHGDGHRQRAIAIAQHYPEQFTLLGTNLKDRTEGLNYIALPDDATNDACFISGSNAAHYLPMHIQNIRSRNSLIANWICAAKPSLFIVDVSTEIALLCNLCSTPTIYMRLAGNRTDSAHLEAFNNAIALICPFPKFLEDHNTPYWVIEKSHYFASLLPLAKGSNKAQANKICLMLGAGGHQISADFIKNMAKQLPNMQIDVIGPLNFTEKLPNVHIYGWVEDYQPIIQDAAIIVGSAGDGLLSIVLNSKKPYICLPQQRPFEEQYSKARALENMGVPVIYDYHNSSINWASLVQKAMLAQPYLKTLDDGKDAKILADLIVHQAFRIANG